MNKNFLKLSTMILGTMFFAGLFSGCSSNKTSNESNTIVIGLDDAFVPLGFRDENGDIVGFDVDLSTEAFSRMGYDVKYQPIDWSMKESELNSKNIDVIWNGYTITNERKNKVNFTNPYLDNRQIIVTLSTSPIKSKEDLKNKKVAVQNGSSSLDALNTEPDLVSTLANGEPILFDTNNDAFMDLESGRSDALVVDEILARYYIQKRGESKYKILEEDFGTEEYGIGIRKSDTDLLNKLNSTLDEMKKDGSAKEISEKWFGENIIK